MIVMSQHWDEFSKSLAEPLPRRESLKRLGLVMTATILGPLGARFASGGHHRGSQSDPCKAFCKCRNKRQQNQCLSACNACDKDTSRLGGSCGNYICCGTDQTPCGGYCADLASDPDNCGACGSLCAAPGPNEYGTCLFGQCEYGCYEGAVYCGDICTFLDSDQANCGSCGNACDQAGPNEYAICISGQCEYGCYDGAVYCGGICTSLNYDPANCGACGNICDALAPYCSGGVCVSGNEPCPGGGTRCNGVCTNTSFDTLNCGGCGIVCGDGETCSGGLCQSPF